MSTFLTFTILGLVLGSVYAVAASGLVLTYTTSGVFNFAHGAQAMIGAFVYWQLTAGWGIPVPLALVLVIGLVGPLMGAGLYAVVMRGLRDTAEVTKIVVTVSVMLGFVALSQWLWDPTQARVIEPLFGEGAVIHFAGAQLRLHELVCILTAVGLALGLRILLRRSRVGVSMRAVVDDPDLLRLNGHDPDRIAMLSWTLGSTLAVVAGVLITPVGGGALEANSLTLLVIDASAAAMFGRLKSIPRTFVGAIGLGLSMTYLVGYAPEGWYFIGNLRVALPMIVLFVVLLVLPHDRLRGAAVRTRERYRVPSVRKAVLWAGLLVVGVVLYGAVLSSSAVLTMAVGLTFSLIALSLTLLTGYAGELNLAPLAMGAVATIVTYHVGVEGTGLAARTSWWGVLLGALAAGIVGVLVALPAARLRGLYLALATVAFGVIVSTLVLRDTTEHTLFGKTFAIFPNGNIIVPPVRVGPIDLRDPTTFLVSVAVLFGLLGLGTVALRNGSYGRRLAAMKDSPVAVTMLGQSVVRLKLGVFFMSSVIAGLGGVFMSMAMGSVSLESYSIIGSLSLVMLTVVTGIGYVSGALFGGLMAGAGFVVLVGTFNDLATANPTMAGPFGLIAHLFAVMPAIIGIGVGRSPSGTLHDLFDSYRAVAGNKPVLWTAGIAVAALYLLTFLGVVGVWTFSIVTLVVVFALPAIAQRFGARRAGAAAALPPELEGIDSSYSPQLRTRLDVALGLPVAPAAASETPAHWPLANARSQVKEPSHVVA